MDEKAYPFQQNRIDFRYTFVSTSVKKEVKKVVIFSEIQENIYNLALLDELENGKLSDITESKNEDLSTIMATVIQIINDFLSKNPKYFVVFRGSDERRQRLYRIIISRDITKILKEFEVYGGIGDESINFYEPNKDYDYFLIKKI